MRKGSSCIKVRARMDQQVDQQHHSISWPSSTKLPGEKRRGWVSRRSSSSSLVFSRLLDSRLLLSSSFPNLREATPRSLESPSLVHAILALVSSTVLPSESPSFSRPRLHNTSVLSPDSRRRRKTRISDSTATFRNCPATGQLIAETSPSSSPRQRDTILFISFVLVGPENPQTARFAPAS